MPPAPGLIDTAVAPSGAANRDMAPERSASIVQPLLIRVDSRERQSPVPALLAAFPDVALAFATLPSADYILSDEVAIERKTASDFVASILDRRLFGQTTRMKVLFQCALLIIEGDLTQVPHSIDMGAIRGALAFLTVRAGITVLQLSDATETAAMLRLMARHAQERMDQPVSLREPRPQIESCMQRISSKVCQGLAHGVLACCSRTSARPPRLCVPRPRRWRKCPGSVRRVPSAFGRL
jgi:ERCC4-type nuclease